VITAPMDPALKLRILTPSASGPDPLGAYVQSYVPRAASLHAPGQEQAFMQEFYGEYAEHLRDTAKVGAELSLNEVDLGAGESAEFDVRLYPNASGKTMIAVAAHDRETDELVAISELVGLTLSPDGGSMDW
jgi:alpha-D-ribose 1-methylphosphonate 5-triphosphate diphosphatase PhnM